MAIEKYGGQTDWTLQFAALEIREAAHRKVPVDQHRRVFPCRRTAIIQIVGRRHRRRRWRAWWEVPNAGTSARWTAAGYRGRSSEPSHLETLPAAIGLTPLAQLTRAA